MKAQEVCDLLGISKEGLKSVMRRNALADRLLEKGYKLLEVKKVGRSNEFVVEQMEIINVQVPTEIWNEFMRKNHPNARKSDSRRTYYQERVMNETIMAKEIAAKAGVTQQTIVAWDDEAVASGLLMYSGYAYFKITSKGLEQVTYGDYVNFWRNFGKTTQAEEELMDMIDNQLTEAEFKIATRGAYVRVKSYLVNRFTEKYQELEKALLESEI